MEETNCTVTNPISSLEQSYILKGVIQVNLINVKLLESGVV
jgi:hypothetical protein